MDELSDDELPCPSKRVDEMAFRGLPRLKRVLARKGVMEDILDYFAVQLARKASAVEAIEEWRDNFLSSRCSRREAAAQFLLFLARHCVTVERLIEACEEKHIDDALMWLKETEPCTIIEDVPMSLEITAGQLMELSCVASGFPRPHYQWTHNGCCIEGATSPFLRLDCTRIQDAGEYSCTVSQTGRFFEDVVVRSITSCSCFVQVAQGPPRFLTISYSIGNKSDERLPQGDEVFVLNVNVGEKLRLLCNVYAWPECGVVWKSGNGDLVGNGTEVDLEFGSTKDGGYFFCEATNCVGKTVSSCISVHVSDPLATMFKFTASVKVALIIENFAYSSTLGEDDLRPLEQAPTEMRSLVTAWESIGFTVLPFVNLAGSEILGTVKSVACRLPKEAYVLFFFLGHGYESCGRRFLMGTDGRPLLFDAIVNNLQGSRPNALVMILDCCRVRRPCPRDIDEVISDNLLSVPSSDVSSDCSNSTNSSSCVLELAPKGKKAKNLIVFSSTGRESFAYERSTKKIVDHLTKLETLSGGFTHVLMGLRVRFQTPDIVSYLTENRSWMDPVCDQETQQNFLKNLGLSVSRSIALRRGFSDVVRVPIPVDTHCLDGRYITASFHVSLDCFGRYALNGVTVAVELLERGFGSFVRGILPVQPEMVEIGTLYAADSCAISWNWLALQNYKGDQGKFGFEVRTRNGAFFCDLSPAVPILSDFLIWA